jgi:hypothetical protein
MQRIERRGIKVKIYKEHRWWGGANTKQNTTKCKNSQKFPKEPKQLRFWSQALN